jgi:hypothetical protein
MKKTARKTIRVFRSFEEENEAEYRRLAGMTPDERLEEFTVLQERAWGEKVDVRAHQKNGLLGKSEMVMAGLVR